METYEHQCFISDWDRIQRNEGLVQSQKFEFKNETITGVHTKWKMGFSFKKPSSYFRSYCKLIEAEDFQDEKVPIIVVYKLLKGDSTVSWTGTENKTMNLGEILEFSEDMRFNSNGW